MKLIKDLGQQYSTPLSKQKKRFGVYECSCCKAHIRVCTYDIKHKRHTDRCNKCKGIKHNMSNSDIYHVWQQMKDRCYNPNSKAYRFYGGKAVSICKEWLVFEAFATWAFLNGYQENLTIDRIESNGDYTPLNCRWIAQSENSYRMAHRTNFGNNKRIKISIDDASEICEAYDTDMFIHNDFAKFHHVSISCINHILRNARL